MATICPTQDTLYRYYSILGRKCVGEELAGKAKKVVRLRAREINKAAEVGLDLFHKYSVYFEVYVSKKWQIGCQLGWKYCARDKCWVSMTFGVNVSSVIIVPALLLLLLLYVRYTTTLNIHWIVFFCLLSNYGWFSSQLLPPGECIQQFISPGGKLVCYYCCIWWVMPNSCPQGKHGVVIRFRTPRGG